MLVKLRDISLTHLKRGYVQALFDLNKSIFRQYHLRMMECVNRSTLIHDDYGLSSVSVLSCLHVEWCDVLNVCLLSIYIDDMCHV